MTLRLLGQGRILILAAALLLIGAAQPTDSAAKSSNRKGTTVKKASHSVAKKQRRAKLSAKKRTPKRSTLTAAEKTEIIEKINALANAELNDDAANSSMTTDAASADDIARAAKEEQDEDDVDVSIDRFFASRINAGEAVSIDPAVLRDRQRDFTLFDETDPQTSATRSDVMQQIIDWLGTRYNFGGLTRSGIDCSAFVREIFRNTFDVELPRTASQQSVLGDPIDKDELRFGDLVFFHTTGHARISHVGIYIGEGLFANASCSKGVTVSSMDSKYWSRRYLFAKRLFTNTETASTEIRKRLRMAYQNDTMTEDTATN
jgi:cell wall-associated NlpC family hydrolase